MRIELKRRHIEGAMQWLEGPMQGSIAGNCPVTRALQEALGNEGLKVYEGRVWNGGRWVWLPFEVQRALLVRPGRWATLPEMRFELPLTVAEERIWRGGK